MLCHKLYCTTIPKLSKSNFVWLIWHPNPSSQKHMRQLTRGWNGQRVTWKEKKSRLEDYELDRNAKIKIQAHRVTSSHHGGFRSVFTHRAILLAPSSAHFLWDEHWADSWQEEAEILISILWSMVEEPQHTGSHLFRNGYLTFLLECLLETLRSFAYKFPDKGHIISPDGIIRLNECYDAILYRRNRKQAHKTAGSSQAQH